MKIKFSIILLFISILKANAQYPPPAGQVGSTAINASSPLFIDWAVNCSVSRGYLDISDTTAIDPAVPTTHFASYGSNLDALGIADNASVSLGDAGEAILTFTHPLANGNGWDFAVFENSFDGAFLELAFVSVSSDGIHYVTFPSTSLTQHNIQLSGFDTMDATKINNLAGKYKVLFGTPFDLNELKDSANLDVNNITHVKITDVVGSILESFNRKDSQGHIINDPYPTPFMTGGFDLDAVGVIHNTTNTGIATLQNNTFINTYPNPFIDKLSIDIGTESVLQNAELSIYSATGELLIKEHISKTFQLATTSFAKGIYLVKISLSSGEIYYKKIVKY